MKRNDPLFDAMTRAARSCELGWPRQDTRASHDENAVVSIPMTDWESRDRLYSGRL